jgi:glycine cleavage system transcriptional repressor
LEASHGLFINCKDIEDNVTAASPAELEASLPRYILSVYGPDKSGLLARITEVLAEHGINITDVQTRVASAGTIYVMVFEIEVPLTFPTETLQAALDAAAQEIGVQVSLHPLDEDTL